MTTRSYPPDPEVTVLQDEAKRLAADIGPDAKYYPDIDPAVRRLRELAGSDVALLTAATPPLGEGEPELPEWAALLNLARLEAARPVDPRSARLDALEAAVNELRGGVTGLLDEVRQMVAQLETDVAQLETDVAESERVAARRPQS